MDRGSTRRSRICLASLVGLALTATACQRDRGPATPPPSAAPSKPAVRPPGAFLGAETAQELRAVAERCPSSEDARLEDCPTWRTHQRRLQPHLHKVRAGQPQAFAALEQAVAGTLPLLDDADARVRTAARRFIELSLLRVQYVERARGAGWWAALLDRLERATDPAEQLDLVRVVGNHAEPGAQGRLEAIARGQAPDLVRAAAWSAVGRCMSRGCTLTTDEITREMEAVDSIPVRAALISLGGRLSHPSLVAWCQPALTAPSPEPALARGCVSGLERLGSPEARRVLLDHVDRLLQASETGTAAPTPNGPRPAGVHATPDLAIVESLSALVRFIDTPEDAGESLRRFERFMMTPGRDALALGIAADRLRLVRARDKAGALLAAAWPVHQARLAGSTSRDETVGLSRLKQTIIDLGAGPAIGERAAPSHGHDHGGHGHGAHEGHDHADHEGHDHPPGQPHVPAVPN